MAVEAGLASPNVAMPGDDSSLSSDVAECDTSGDLSRHARLVLRMLHGHWGLGIVFWLSEEDIAPTATSCDYFGRGVWPFGEAQGGAAGVAFGAGTFGMVSAAGVATRNGGPLFSLIDPESPANDASGSSPNGGSSVDADDGDDGDDDASEPKGNPFGSTPSFSVFDGPPTLDPDWPNGDGTGGTSGTITPQGFRVDQAAPVPEPGSLLLMATGLAAAWRRRRRH